MFPRYVFICFLRFSIFMKLRLFTNLYAIHSFSYCLFMNWITLVPTPIVRKLSILYMLETDNSCFSWILLCLICFFIDYMKAWKWSRHCFFWAQLPPTILSIVLVSVWAFVTPFEPFWLSSMLFGWWLLFFLEPSTLCCCMNFCLAVKSKEYSRFNVSWIQVGERMIICLLVYWELV